MEQIWDSELDTGHGKMDRDHKRMVVIINHLADGIENDKGTEFFDLMLNELVREVQEHFAVEEKIMAAQQYHNAAAHKAEHALLLKQADNLRQWFAWGPSAATECSALLEFFEYSLVIHILSADKCLTEVREEPEHFHAREAGSEGQHLRLRVAQ
jgi:hemerythrin